MHTINQMKSLMLKSFLLVFMTQIATTSTTAQTSSGIIFFEGDWQAVLNQAKLEDKMIFVDCYTSWCGPCKKLAKEVFPDQEVGNFFNKHFISVKIDMEKGEGIELKDKFKVSAFPTMLFITKQDIEQHRIVGFISADKLIAEAKKASSDKNFGSMHAHYINGQRDEAFIKEYIQVLKSAGKREELNALSVELLMDIKPQLWLKENNWAMIKAYVNDPHSDIIRYVQENQNRFIAIYGQRSVEMKLYSAFSGGTRQFLIDEDSRKYVDEEGYEAYIQMLKDLNVTRWENIKTDTDMHFAFALENWPEYVRLVNHKIESLGDMLHPQLLWNYAMRVNQACPDIETRSYAAGWCELAIERTPEERSSTAFNKTLEELKLPMPKNK